MTYARARLWTGISGVGFVVVLSLWLLSAGACEDLLGDSGGAFASDFASLFGVLSVAALVMLPFDLAGGLILPRRFGRPAPTTLRFFGRWLRGVTVLTAMASLTGSVLLMAGRFAGVPLALALFVIIGNLYLWIQAPLACLVGGLRKVEPQGALSQGLGKGLLFLRGEDPAFTGGFSGPPTGLVGGPAKIILPERWLELLDPEALATLVERRRKIVSSHAHGMTAFLSLLWNLAGFWLACSLPSAGVGSVAELVATALWFSLWTFLGLLLLPTLSRRGTHRADALLSLGDGERERFLTALSTIDQLQDDEPSRSPGVESVFHPVPSLSTRLSPEAARGAERAGAWHLARTSLFLSHVGLSLLPRAVHCNSGRPELWVYLPGDG